MNTLVVLRMVPDVVEELVVDASGKALDSQWLRFILNESDEHALEEALLLKEQLGGVVTAAALDAPEVDDALFTAAAKGADRVMKVARPPDGAGAWAQAAIFARLASLSGYDLILTGVQASDELDGSLAPMLAAQMQWPYAGPVVAVRAEPAAREVIVECEVGGGARSEFRAPLPCVLGIQAAEKPPRYVAVSRLRQVMRTTQIAEVDASAEVPAPWVTVSTLRQPEVSARAEMLEGSLEEIAEQLATILAQRGIL
jgi:electron transfer flavoprotein beta subunit